MAGKDGELIIRFDDSEWKRVEKKLDGRTTNWEPAAKRIHAEMKVRIDSVFAKNRGGGKHRGIRWKYFAPQYTRKDGTVVPAWGGVPYADGSSGIVKGRLRPSRQRIAAGDAVGQDTGHLRRAAFLAYSFRKERLTMGTNVEYASDFSRLRPFLLWFLPSDLNMIRDRIIRFFEKG